MICLFFLLLHLFFFIFIFYISFPFHIFCLSVSCLLLFLNIFLCLLSFLLYFLSIHHLMLSFPPLENMLRFDFPSPPPARHLTAALDELVALGALTEVGTLTKPLGQQMAEFPLSPQLAKMLLVSGGCGSYSHLREKLKR